MYKVHIILNSKQLLREGIFNINSYYEKVFKIFCIYFVKEVVKDYADVGIMLKLTSLNNRELFIKVLAVLKADVNLKPYIEKIEYWCYISDLHQVKYFDLTGTNLVPY